MPLTYADAILLALVVVIAPLSSYFQRRRILRGVTPNRTAAYLRMMRSWWLIAAAIGVVWFRLGRPAALLGLTVPLDARSLLGAILCLLMLAYVHGQRRVVYRLSPQKLESLRRRYASTASFLPHSGPEYRLFLGVATTAGVCEELLYRGYFFAAASDFFTPAEYVVAGAIFFGLGHAYQGFTGMVKSAYVGLVLGIVYAGSGSLLWPILLHVLLDVAAGIVGYRAFGADTSV